MVETPKHCGYEPVSPIYDIRIALSLAQKGLPYYEVKGQTPDVFRSEMLRVLHLNGAQPDGLTLADRFAGNDNLSPKNFAALMGTVRGIDRLIEGANDGTINPMQKLLAKDLAVIASRQIEREHDVCPLAADFVMRAPDWVFSDHSIKQDVMGIIIRDRLRQYISAAVSDGQSGDVVISLNGEEGISFLEGIMDLLAPEELKKGNSPGLLQKCAAAIQRLKH